MAKPFDVQTYGQSLAAGAELPVQVLDFWALVAGAGLQFCIQGRGGRYMDLPLFFVFGDGEGPLGTISVKNPTGAPVVFSVLTSTRKFDPQSLGGSQNVSITSSVALVTSATAVGAAAHDAPVSGAPLLVGAEARTNERAWVGEGDAVRLAADRGGKLIALPYALPGDLVHGQGNPVAAADVAILAAHATLRHYLADLTIANFAAAVATVIIKDGATERFRVRVPADSTIHIARRCPLRGTAATAWNAALGGAGDVFVSVSGFAGT